MNKPKMTLGEALLLDWKRELKNGDPKRILQLIYPATVLYILIHFIIAPPLRVYYRLRKYVILSYAYTRHYFFLGLHNLRAWTGLYTDERKSPRQ